ncbi:hypothetical protein BpHYR1_000541 [Brachionus plicatilis]|uniref:Uncharacterized protein n=1 Tax=Brachionus plicatilis TaxID=10195 RepID=A0A3M7PJ29_BRAPC|nr:hypothetical protein BpHYR1_000541 [Brachionus plicatilis]
MASSELIVWFRLTENNLALANFILNLKSRKSEAKAVMSKTYMHQDQDQDCEKTTPGVIDPEEFENKSDLI